MRASAYEALANGSVDFTLEISTWEGVNSILLERPQRAFRYADFGVPEQQTTLIGGNTTWLHQNPEEARAFVQATQRGYQFAVENPMEAANILMAGTAGMLSNPELVYASMDALIQGGYLKDPGEPVGLIDAALFSEISVFLFTNNILRGDDGRPLTTLPDVTTWFTNQYLAR